MNHASALTAAWFREAFSAAAASNYTLNRSTSASEVKVAMKCSSLGGTDDQSQALQVQLLSSTCDLSSLPRVSLLVTVWLARMKNVLACLVTSLILPVSLSRSSLLFPSPLSFHSSSLNRQILVWKTAVSVYFSSPLTGTMTGRSTIFQLPSTSAGISYSPSLPDSEESSSLGQFSSSGDELPVTSPSDAMLLVNYEGLIENQPITQSLFGSLPTESAAYFSKRRQTQAIMSYLSYGQSR